MFGFFQTIIGYIETVWAIVLNLVEGLFQLASTLVTVSAMPGILITFMPAFLTSAILSVGALAVLKVVVGR